MSDTGMSKRYTIDDEWTGARVDRLLRVLYPGVPFAVIQTLLRKGKVTLNGKRVGGGARLAVGDTIEVREEIERPASARTAAAAFGPTAPAGPQPAGERRPAQDRRRPVRGGGLAVLYEDDEVLVLDKPAGIVVQPGNRKELGSIIDLLEAQRPRAAAAHRGTAARPRRPASKRASPGRKPPPFPWTPVHRLDRETTGVLVVAKTRAAARALSAAFSSGRIEKIYLAAVEGSPSAPRGTIALPLEVEKGRRSTAKVAPAGRRAETEYRVLRAMPGGRSLLEIRITTGRTHQIRAHLAAVGHPVAGDRRYGRGIGGAGGFDGRQRDHGAARGSVVRRRGPLMLHAWKISFPHPAGTGRIEATAPPPTWAQEKE